MRVSNAEPLQAPGYRMERTDEGVKTLDQSCSEYIQIKKEFQMTCFTKEFSFATTQIDKIIYKGISEKFERRKQECLNKSGQVLIQTVYYGSDTHTIQSILLGFHGQSFPAFERFWRQATFYKHAHQASLKCDRSNSQMLLCKRILEKGPMECCPAYVIHFVKTVKGLSNKMSKMAHDDTQPQLYGGSSTEGITSTASEKSSKMACDDPIQSGLNDSSVSYSDGPREEVTHVNFSLLSLALTIIFTLEVAITKYVIPLVRDFVLSSILIFIRLAGDVQQFYTRANLMILDFWHTICTTVELIVRMVYIFVFLLRFMALLFGGFWTIGLILLTTEDILFLIFRNHLNINKIFNVSCIMYTLALVKFFPFWTLPPSITVKIVISDITYTICATVKFVNRIAHIIVCLLKGLILFSAGLFVTFFITHAIFPEKFKSGTLSVEVQLLFYLYAFIFFRFYFGVPDFSHAKCVISDIFDATAKFVDQIAHVFVCLLKGLICFLIGLSVISLVLLIMHKNFRYGVQLWDVVTYFVTYALFFFKFYDFGITACSSVSPYLSQSPYYTSNNVYYNHYVRDYYHYYDSDSDD
ncbi:uncharacterized protein LOC117647971 isoform X2 [Thrips palmi]|uniref:Uncharacterized protein LOC117647971 isoform X2 n=1 Tax=Thrips palmi TaxID=161013 RepID=A0A6P8Z0C7_THRPL|nr:uncharacterized protein LOC117647971 isoform X2 [Thrips palmi]